MAGPSTGKTQFVVGLVTVVASVLASYFATQNITNQRITVVETQGAERWEMVKSSLARIEGRLDRRDQEMQSILQDWLNGIDRRTGEPLPLQRAIERRR